MAKKITQKMIREALKDGIFRPDSPPTFLYRYADLCPGMSVVEYRPNRKGAGSRLYSVRAYQGESSPQRWQSISMVSLKEASSWANERADQAKRLWEEEV